MAFDEKLPLRPIQRQTLQELAAERQEIISDLEAQGMPRGLAKHLTFGWEFVGGMSQRTSSTQPNESNVPKKLGPQIIYPKTPVPWRTGSYMQEIIKPHPIVKIAAELAGALSPAELAARKELRYLARRWQTKLRPPLVVAAGLRAKGALWRRNGAGSC
jgi:hypothetical protein